MEIEDWKLEDGDDESITTREAFTNPLALVIVGRRSGHHHRERG
jgi:hypothetical protein